MSLLFQPYMQLSDANGLAMAFAEAYFYLTGTTDPVAVFADSDLTDEHTVPLVADDAGIFPAIYFDGTEVLRMKVVAADGDLGLPLLDIDPVNELFTVFAANIADGAIEEKLGYTPVDPANAVFTANARLNFVPTELNIDDIGFRGTPVTIKNAAYSIDFLDSGRLLVKDDNSTPTWTITKDIFPVGHWFDVHNSNTGEVFLVRDDDVELRGADSSVDEDKELPPYYKGRVTQVVANEWVLDPNPTPATDLSVNGYFQLPNGYIRQWGKYTGVKLGDTTQEVTFPIPFPTACLGAGATAWMDGTPAITADMSVAVNAFDLTDLTVYVSGPADEEIDGFYWEAWGH